MACKNVTNDVFSNKRNLPWVHHGYLPGANQIDLFMHFLGASRYGLVARRVDLDTISSSESGLNWSFGDNFYQLHLDVFIKCK
jgi:hypothetical protein